MPTTFTLAHLSDPHLGPLVGLHPSEWRFKRLTGLINWHRNRRHVHLAATLAALVADLHQQAPDHIAVTGDLANLGLPRELADAQTWLERIGPPEQVSVVPGNHDIYVPFGRDPGVERWSARMASNPAGAEFAEPPVADRAASDRFPYVRRFGPVALVGVNSAVPMPPFIAAGRVGLAQAQRLGRVLGRLGDAGVVRIVLIHHPPLRAQAPVSRGMQDARETEHVLTRFGAELVLHGHMHVAMQYWWPGPTGPIPIIGVPSASLGRPHKREVLARYNLYRVKVGEGVAIELIERGLEAPEGPVVELGRMRL